MKTIKEMLKNNSSIRRIVKKKKIKKEYKLDYRDFCEHYNDSEENTTEKQDYKIMLLVHSLEKGMCHENMRPFGDEKIMNLISLIRSIDSDTTAKRIGISMIHEWTLVVDVNNFPKTNSYKEAKKLLSELNANCYEKVGNKEYIPTESSFDIDYYAFLKSRHSVRDFSSKLLKKTDIDYCIKSALLSPTACNRQMIRIYAIKDTEKKQLLDKTIMGLSGFKKDSIQYFVITFNLSAFSFYGERNQGYFNAGLVSMNFVNALHSKGIGSCFLQWGNTQKEENMVKNKLNIPKNERIAVVIASGYYKEKHVIPESCRKNMDDIYTEL